jgi:hypothetical protein
MPAMQHFYLAPFIKNVILLLAALVISTQVDAMFKWNSHRNLREHKTVISTVQAITHSRGHFQYPTYRQHRTHSKATRQWYHQRAEGGKGYGIASLIAGAGALAIGVFVLASITLPPVAPVLLAVLAVTAIVCGAIGVRHSEGRAMAFTGLFVGAFAILFGAWAMLAVAIVMAF